MKVSKDPTVKRAVYLENRLRFLFSSIKSLKNLISFQYGKISRLYFSQNREGSFHEVYFQVFKVKIYFRIFDSNEGKRYISNLHCRYTSTMFWNNSTDHTS